jgi:hypothetical protein
MDIVISALIDRDGPLVKMLGSLCHTPFGEAHGEALTLIRSAELTPKPTLIKLLNF